MILTIGLVFNSFLVLLSTDNKNSEIMKRIWLMVMAIYLMNILWLYGYLISEIGIYDGMVRVCRANLIKEALVILFGIVFIYIYQEYTVQSNVISILVLQANMVGSVLLFSCNDFLTALLWLELVNYSVYILLAINAKSELNITVTLKYIIYSILVSVIMLGNVAYIYYNLGSTSFPVLDILFSYNYFGGINLSLIVIVFMFKLTLFPLHLYNPELMQSQPTHITMWMLNMNKLVYVLFLITLVEVFNIVDTNSIIVIGIVSYVIGCIGLVLQYTLPRFLAMSGTANMGLVLVSLGSIEYMYMYLIVYLVTMANIFIYIRRVGIVDLSDLRGKMKSEPLITLLFTLNIMSLIGIPPCLGFYTKMLILTDIIMSNHLFILVLFIIGTIIGAYNYIRIMNLTLSSKIEPVTNVQLNHCSMPEVYFMVISTIVMILGNINFIELCYVILLN
jgi:NADH-quinone oxidoreductase subunit N